MSQYSPKDLPPALGMVHDLGMAALGPGWKAAITLSHWRDEWFVEFHYQPDQGLTYIVVSERRSYPGEVSWGTKRIYTQAASVGASERRLREVVEPWIKP